MLVLFSSVGCVEIKYCQCFSKFNLMPPTEEMAMDTSQEEERFLRPTCERVNCSERFVRSNMPCEKQYANIYFVRSTLMKKRLLITAEEKWGDEYPVTPLAKLQAGKKCCIIGTIFKVMELQPSILKEVRQPYVMVAMLFPLSLFQLMSGNNVIRS